jgi:hypothetical protein
VRHCKEATYLHAMLSGTFLVSWMPYESIKGKIKGHPITGHQGPKGGAEVLLYSFSTSALGGGGFSARRPGRFTAGKDSVPIVQEAGWAPGPVWTCAKNLAPTGIRSLDCPARSQSLYRLNYPSHHMWVWHHIMSYVEIDEKKISKIFLSFSRPSVNQMSKSQSVNGWITATD